MSHRERRLQGDIATFLRQYGRRKPRQGEPNDRAFSEASRRKFDQMTALQIAALLDDRIEPDSVLLDWLEPWEPVSDSEADQLDAELTTEVGDSHPLHGTVFRAIARRVDRTAIAFLLDDPKRVAVVHLTFSGSLEDPPQPATEMHASLARFKIDRMVRDHRDLQDAEERSELKGSE